MQIKRTFHPIGQGGFFTEQHLFAGGDNFTIVYDCGVTGNSRDRDFVVQHPDLHGIDIDVLFISHFDSDHVSMLNVLKNHVRQIKKVVMPLLHDDERILLTNLFRALGQNILTLINHPQKFFGPDTKIIQIEPSDGVDGNPRDPITFTDQTPSGHLPSGTRIRIGLPSAPAGHDWTFIPHNHRCASRRSALETALVAAHYDLTSLRTDPGYTLDKAIHNRAQLKTIYNGLPGGINQNSLFVYSGPEQTTTSLKLISYWEARRDFSTVSSTPPRKLNHLRALPFNGFVDFFHPPRPRAPRTIHFPSPLYPWHWSSNKPGCLYTGDGDLNSVAVQQVFSRVWDHVGTLQIPHHGASACFHDGALLQHPVICPIAVGTTNGHGHPAGNVFSTIYWHRSIPVLVTDKSFEYVQLIR